MERDFKGIWIPKDIWLNKSLSIQEKLFLVEIDSLDRGQGCWANNYHFEELFGYGRSRTNEIFRGLLDKGMITRTLQGIGNNDRVLSVNRNNPYGIQYGDPIRDSAQPHTGFRTHKNTINNTDILKRNIKEKGGLKRTVKPKYKDITFPCQKEHKEILQKWFDYKRSRNQTYNSSASKETCYKNLLKISNNNSSTAEEIVERSIGCNWAGLFPLTEPTNKPSNTGGTRVHSQNTIDYSKIKVKSITEMRKNGEI